MNEAPQNTYMYPPPPPGYENWHAAQPDAPAEQATNYPPFQNWGGAYSAPPTYYPPYPAYNAPAPYPYYGPMPQQRQNKGWIWAVVIIIGMLFVGCIALGGLGYAFINGYREDGGKTIDTFMQAARSKNVEQMYQQLSSSGKTAFSRRTLQDYLTQRGTYLSKYKSLTTDDFDVSSGTGRNITLSLGGTIAYTDGRSSRFSARLTQENENWLIDSFTLDPPK